MENFLETFWSTCGDMNSKSVLRVEDFVAFTSGADSGYTFPFSSALLTPGSQYLWAMALNKRQKLTSFGHS
jgi:hypothetical protein